MKSLTSTQKEILEYVLTYQEENGRTPTGPEIAEKFGYSQARTAYDHLERIEKKGYLTIRQPSERGLLNLQLTEKAKKLFSPGFPLLGSIPAGPVSEVGEDLQEGRVSSLTDLVPTMKEGDYFLRVDGDSMIGAGISEGAMVQIRPGVEPSDGDICAVWVEGDGGTLKRVFREGETVRLIPENEKYDPREVPADRVRIQGILVATVDVCTFRGA
jgi:repressor LexA